MSRWPFVLMIILICQGTSISEKDAKGSISEWFWDATLHTRLEALNTNVVKGVQNGMLDPIAFQVYYLQDIMYMFDSADAFDIAAKKAQDIYLQQFLEHHANSSRSYGESLFAQLPLTDLLAIKLESQFKGYSDHLLNVALDKTSIYSIVAIIPCRRLWPWIGTKINATTHNYGPYEKWVGENFNQAYDGYKKYENIFDAAFAKGLIDPYTAFEIYSKSMNFEVACFNSVK